MAVTADKPAPYATTSSVLELIERHRNRGLPSPVNAEVLGRAGVSDSLIPRTLQTLQTLDLIDSDGNPTETFEGIRLAPEPEFKKRLEEWLNGAYADVISFVDPAKNGETEVRDAFRSYRPVAQQPRMVTLFRGLYAAAGIAPEKPTQPPRTRTPKPASAKIAPRKKTPQSSQSGVPAPLAGLLSSLPPEGQGWTQSQHDKFLNTFGAVLDYCFPITENEAPDPEHDSE